MNEKDIAIIEKIKEKLEAVNKVYLPSELLSTFDGVLPYIISSQFLIAILLLMLEENGCSDADIEERLNELKILSKTL